MNVGISIYRGADTLAFVAMWTVMMVAMMFPASAPMILTFSAIQARKRAAARPYVPVSVFTASYVLVWALFGVVAFGFAAGLDWLAERSQLLMTSWPRIAGGLIVAAGVYQLTPLKDTCLSKCRSPVSFLLAHWRDGWSGAFVVGFLHGIYCAGCCWLLFVILVPLAESPSGLKDTMATPRGCSPKLWTCRPSESSHRSSFPSIDPVSSRGSAGPGLKASDRTTREGSPSLKRRRPVSPSLTSTAPLLVSVATRSPWRLKVAPS